MKNLLFYAVIAFGLMLSPQLFAQQGIGTNLPDKSAALEIVSNQRGLLIPRFGIPDLDAAAPVTDPAHALLVFNDGTEGGTAPGFYWWDENANTGAGAWKAVTGEAGEPGDAEVTLTGDDPIIVQNLGENSWNISLDVGNDGDVLVTDANGEAVWTPIEDFIETVNIVGDNGITIFEDANTGEQVVQLGGTLTEPATEITTDGDNNTLSITGLVDLTQDVEDGNLDLADFDVVIMNDTGILRRISTTQLMSEADVELDINFENGLTQIGDVVKLGGNLNEATTLTTDETNTLAVAGLQAANAPNKIVVAEDAEGVLRTVTRSLQDNISANYSIFDDLPNYSAYVQEINLAVNIADLTGGDITITLPDAAPADGQVINVKLSGGTEADNYLSIQDAGGGELTYGALPHQAWIFKSNGTNWQIVGKN